MRNIDHMHQQVGFAHLVERRFERLDQFGRQFADEADRIRKQKRQVVEDHLADRGVERGEELVLGKDLALRNQVHQRRFADVGIAHQRHADHRTAVGALDRHLTVDLLQILLELGDPVADDTAVGLDFAFARAAAGPRTAPLPFEVGPHTRKPGQHVLVIGQLHLRLGIGGLRPRHENIEDQARTVEDAARHRLFDIARLRRRQFVVEDRHVDLLLLAVAGDLLQFAGTDVDTGRRLRKPLREALHALDIGRLGQKLQFVEELGGLPGVLIVTHDGDQHGTLPAVGSRSGIRSLISVFFQFVFQILTLHMRRAPESGAAHPEGEQTLCYK